MGGPYCLLTPKIGKYRGSLCSLGEPVRPVVATGQTGLSNIVKLPIELHHCVYLVETIEMHIWIVQFGVRMRKLCLPEDSHPGLTGPGRSDWFGDRLDRSETPIRVMSYILTQNLLGFC